MSKISTDTMPKRGAKIDSPELNNIYTDINSGFPLAEDNVRNEGLALPQFDTYAQSGESGIILKSADAFVGSHGAGTIVRANEATVFPYDAPQLIQEESLLILTEDDDILRVYFQIEAEVSGSNASPIGAGTNDMFWVFWLEWQLSSGGAWEPVQGNTSNQTDYEDILISPSTYGGFTEDSIAAIFVNHCYVHSHSSSTDVDFPPKRGHCGNYFLLENTGGRNIYGLRVMARGLMRGGYVSGGVSGDGNAGFITISPASTHQITVYNSDISYVQMRNK